MNIDSLLDPRGGDGYADGINSGLLGLMGFAADRGIVGWAYGKPMRKKINRDIREARKAMSVFGPVNQPLIDSKWSSFTKRRYSGSAYFKDALHTSSPLSYRALLQERKSIKLASRSASSTARSLGWMFIIEGLSSMGNAAFSPGVNQVTMKKEMMTLADESPFDSARSATGRQRALQAIHDSQMSVRNVISNEASYLHK